MSRVLIRRPVFLDRDRNAAFAITAIASSLFFLAYSGHFGKWTILAFYATWFPILFYNPQPYLAAPQRLLLLLVLPGVATLSMLWSQEPSASLRHGIQFGTTVAAAAIAARVISFENLAKGMIVGGVLIILYSLYDGEYSYDVIDGSYAFAGAFESKNLLGWIAVLTMVPAVCLLTSRQRSRGWTLPSLAAIPLSVFILWIAQSTTAILISAAAILVVLFLRASLRFAPLPRRILFFFSGCVLALGAYGLYSAGFFAEVLAIFGKDATLTGRTYLWNQAIKAGSEHSAFGWGYRAFWVHGQPDAERLWHEFYIPNRSGFHFHNTILETYVELGIAGAAIVISLMLITIILAVRGALGRMQRDHATLYAAFGTALLIRSLVEVDFVTEYSLSTFLLTFFLLASLDEQARAKRPRRAVRRGPARAAAVPPGPPAGVRASR